MLKKTAAVALAAAALMLNAPAAQADAPVRTCRFYAASADGVNYNGVIAGSITHAGGGPVSITCYLKVNGAIAGGTFAFGSGDITAVAANAISFQADDFDIVEVCTDFTTTHGTTTGECFETVSQTDPSPFITGLLCPITEPIGDAGFDILGIIRIDEFGNVFVLGIRVVDCQFGNGLPGGVRFG